MKFEPGKGRLFSEHTALGYAILEASPDCMTLLQTDATILYVNSAAAQAYSHTGTQPLVGSRWGARFKRAYRELAENALRAAQAGRIGNFIIASTDGRYWDVVVASVRDASGTIVNLIVISRDVTKQQQAESKILWGASHDTLTGLANRSLLQVQMDEAVVAARANGGGFGMLMLDIDHFKTTNDTHGHDAGDAVLRAFAERLTRASRKDDLIARLGGDEFAVLLRGVKTEEELEAAIGSIRPELCKPLLYRGAVVGCNASIGASLYPSNGSNKEALMKSADVALYAAKSAGRGNYKIFKPAMLVELERQQVMLRIAADALEQNRIVPFYQPKVDLQTGRLIGYEALLRWQHAELGAQTPDTLMAAFHDGQLAPRLSRRIISRVISDIQSWKNAGIEVGPIAVNAAAADFVKGDFAEYLLEQLASAKLPFSAVQVEVTETVFLGRGAECVEDALKLLSAEGVKIALDDFGTGYASLTHLRNFPIDIIKIDRSFLQHMETSADSRAIVEAVIALGRSLDISVVAEGVETVWQHAELVKLGCPYGQGFLYGKAASFSEVEGPKDMALALHRHANFWPRQRIHAVH